MKPELIIKKGSDISSGSIEKIDKLWQKAFPGNEPVSTKNRKAFSNDIFFMLFEGKEILSLGRLRPVKMKSSFITCNFSCRFL